MIKRVFLSLLVITISVLTIQAQDNVGIGTTTPDASALLDLVSSDKGLLIPRVELFSVDNNTSPVNNPATGLLVYNESGSLDTGFYYWDGTEWVLVGSGGGAATGCVTLDEAYDCETAGAGRAITASDGSVEITLPSGGTSDAALNVISNKGTTPSPSSAIDVLNSQYGVGIYAEITNTSNPYGVIQAISNSSLTGSDLPSGVSGYHDGTGLGVGIWGETSSNSTAGSSYGIYGLSSGTGNGFGGYFMSQTYPGIFAETSSASSQAAQFASGSQSPLNPAMLAVGSVQFMSGAGGTYGNNVLFNNVAGEITIASDNGQYGYLGTAGIEWYYLYYYNAVQASRRELKRDITYTDEEISDFLMSEIEQMKPAFYKYNLESDELIAGKEQKTRYNMHMGFILDETPDYIQDNSFSGIDIYALSTLSISGVQHNRKSIVEIEEKIENSVSQISDFGIAEINGTEIYVEYSQDFKGETPVVNITPNSPVSNFYISSQNDKGFTLSVNGVENFRFNWVALARYSYDTPVKSETYNIDPALMSQLRVDQAKKEQIHNLLMRTQEDLMELKSPDSNKNSVKRFIKK